MASEAKHASAAEHASVAGHASAAGHDEAQARERTAATKAPAATGSDDGHLPVSELIADRPAAPSPFGDDQTFPLPVERLTYRPAVPS